MSFRLPAPFALAPLALGLAALTLSSCDRTPKADPDNPAAYKLRLTVEPAPGGTLQRVMLPAEALVVLREKDLGDVRLFDGRGKPLALARDGTGAATAEAQRSRDVPVFPVMGEAGAIQGGRVTIAIDDAKVAHVVTVNTGGVATGGTPQVVAALLDTPAISEPAVAITLDADLPKQTPVTALLESSNDLKSWDYLGEKVLFRSGDGPALLGSGRIALAGASLKDRYVRVSWDDTAGVSIKGAKVTTARTAPPPRLAVDASGQRLADPRELRFSVPFATPLAALRLTETGQDGVVPVKAYGRDDAEEPWVPLAAGIVRQGSAGSAIDLGGASFRHYRIEADKRSAGFSQAPRLELLLDPVEVLATFNGVPPYTLAAGQAGTKSAYFAASDLAPAATLTGPLPQASVTSATTAPPSVAVQPEGPDGALSPRKLVLWGALLLGTAVLAFAAFRLMRSSGKPAA